MMFQATDFSHRKRRYELLARAVFFSMTLLIVAPLILIVGYLAYQAWPILSLDFLLTNPRNGMRAGGVWSPLLGTIYLVVISLMVAAPIGVLSSPLFGKSNALAGDFFANASANRSIDLQLMFSF